MDERPQGMCLVVESDVPSALDVDPSDGNLVALAGGESAKFSLRRRWIPEHPVPIALGPCDGKGGTRMTVLLIDPADANRFRVRECRMPALPRSAYAAFAAVATVAAVTLNALSVAVAAAMLSAMLFVSLFPGACSWLIGRYWMVRCSVREAA